ncbi:hypothetical protein, partial [Streptomyces sp. AK04-3B]|uniref:hypothetical protein n=1 Tax=Streptomyces sp. AK04-3B TaxID=3028650 RepID=UPI0029BCC129
MRKISRLVSCWTTFALRTWGTANRAIATNEGEGAGTDAGRQAGALDGPCAGRGGGGCCGHA